MLKDMNKACKVQQVFPGFCFPLAIPWRGIVGYRGLYIILDCQPCLCGFVGKAE